MSESIFNLYKYCPNCSHQLETKGPSKTCPSCGKHYYFNSRPTITAIIKNDKSEYLLVKRKVEPFKGWWDLPGGFVEENETLEKAAQRELLEELGINIDHFDYIGSFTEDYKYQDAIYPLVAAVFDCKLPSDSIIKVGDDVNDYKFFAKDAVPIEQIAFPNQRQFFEKYLRQE